MNERIKELAEQAGYSKDYLEIGLPSNMEKFAKLIIQECLNQCYNRGMNDSLYEGQLKAASYIEQHFGVKE
jgi:hypothetical protein